MKWVKKIGLVLIVLACLSAAYEFWAMFTDQSEVAEHVEAVDWLPATASNISYYVNKNISGIVACEFTMAESDFLDLATKHEWQMDKIESSTSMTRYTWFVEGSKPSDHYATIEQGYYYSKRRPSGAGITVAYDLERQVVYVMRSSR